MPGGKPPGIRAAVIGLGRLAGARPSERQPLPGAEKVWQGLERLSRAVQAPDALGGKRLEQDHAYKCGTLKGRALRLEGLDAPGREWIHRHVRAGRDAGGTLWKRLRRRDKRPCLVLRTGSGERKIYSLGFSGGTYALINACSKSILVLRLSTTLA